MRLFRTTDDFVFSFGFNMQERKPDLHYIGWWDPTTQEWDANLNNLAGWIRPPFIVAPQFIKEVDGTVVAFQSGLMVVLTKTGPPFAWTYAVYTPDQWDALQAA